jgi:peptidoglycan/LPS O-acetylase OafA/YrhL
VRTEEVPQRLDALTGLRWWAAFLVFLFHMLVFAPIPGAMAVVFGQGYFGVTFFFVLSGFVLTWSARPEVSTSTFYWRRFARIWPAHIVALIIAVPVFYTLAAVPEGSFLKPFDLGVLLLSVVLVQAWSNSPAILFSGNPAAWTLTCEAFFYALHPWISKLLMRCSRRGALIVASGILVWAFGYRGLVTALPGSILSDLPTPVVRVPEFILGMALAWAVRSGWRLRVPVTVGVGSMFVVVGTIVVVSHRLPQAPVLRYIPYFGNELFTVACALAIVSLVQRALTGRRSVFEAAWMVKLGEWSFAFYLVHATFIYLALRIFGFAAPAWHNLLWFALLLVVDLVAAWALHSLVERPLEKRMRRWKDRRAAARSTSTMSATDPVGQQNLSAERA